MLLRLVLSSELLVSSKIETSINMEPTARSDRMKDASSRVRANKGTTVHNKLAHMEDIRNAKHGPRYVRGRAREDERVQMRNARVDRRTGCWILYNHRLLGLLYFLR